MIVVRRKAEVIRFGAFLVVMALMAYYVAGKMEVWRTSRMKDLTDVPAAGDGAAKQGREAAPRAETGGGAQAALMHQEPAGASDFFAEFRMGRERSRGALRETLREIMESQTADAETRKQASQQYLQVGRFAALEERAEAMVRAKGFEDVVVNLVEGTAQVVVRSSGLSEQQAVQVMDLVSRITGVKPGAIQVMHRDR